MHRVTSGEARPPPRGRVPSEAYRRVNEHTVGSLGVAQRKSPPGIPAKWRRGKASGSKKSVGMEPRLHGSLFPAHTSAGAARENGPGACPKHAAGAKKRRQGCYSTTALPREKDVAMWAHVTARCATRGCKNVASVASPTLDHTSRQSKGPAPLRQTVPQPTRPVPHRPDAEFRSAP